MLLTISIPTHNSSHYLDQALESIINEPGLGINYEITLSDNSLSEETNKLYKSKYSKIDGINYHRSLEYESLDSNVNHSVELANGLYVWIFGDDDLIVPGSIFNIITFLNTYKPNLLVVNSQSFNSKGLIEKSRIPISNNLIYNENKNDKFLSEFGSYLTYIGAIIVKRNLWIENYDKSKIGSYFAHLDALFNIKNGRIVHFLAKESIKMRVGSQIWTAKSFEIWNIYFSEIVWGLKGYSDFSKNKVISRFPFNSPKSLLSSRAYGRLDFNIWKQSVYKSKTISIPIQLFILFICLLPRFIFVYLYRFIIKNLRQKQTLSFSPDLALSQLKL